MTCIIGVVDKGKVYIGGDSAGVAGSSYEIRKDEKVFKKGNMIYGFSGSFRMGQILRYSFDLPAHPSDLTDFAYLCTVFVDELIKCFTDKGYAEIESSVVSGGFFLLGYRGNLYKIESDFQVGAVHRAYNACGCGEEYALGAMELLIQDESLSPEDKIKKALSVSESFCTGVKAPFNIVSI